MGTRQKALGAVLTLVVLVGCASTPPPPPDARPVLCTVLRPLRFTEAEILALSEPSYQAFVRYHRILEEECGFTP